MADIQVKTLINNDGYTVTGNTSAGEDLINEIEELDEGIMRPKSPSGDVGFVRESDSLTIGGSDNLNPAVNAAVAAQNKPVGT
ncbi:MAG: hypothetical protein LBD54_01410 [Puniceicoccales bacterium]|jgi:hypothetical protein|nr:hypothetical protein [Puniceicoccales bacterium]